MELQLFLYNFHNLLVQVFIPHVNLNKKLFYATSILWCSDSEYDEKQIGGVDLGMPTPTAVLPFMNTVTVIAFRLHKKVCNNYFLPHLPIASCLGRSSYITQPANITGVNLLASQ